MSETWGEYPAPWFDCQGFVSNLVVSTLVYHHVQRGVFVLKLEIPETRMALAVKLSSLRLCSNAAREINVLRAVQGQEAALNFPKVYTLDTKPVSWLYQFKREHNLSNEDLFGVVVTNFYKDTALSYVRKNPAKKLFIAELVAKGLLQVMEATKLAIFHQDLHAANVFVVERNGQLGVVFWDVGQMLFYEDQRLTMTCLSLDMTKFIGHLNYAKKNLVGLVVEPRT